MQDSVLVPDPGKPLTQVHLLFYNTDLGGHLFAIQSSPFKLLIVVDLSRAYRSGYHYQITVGDIVGYSVLAAFNFVSPLGVLMQVRFHIKVMDTRSYHSWVAYWLMDLCLRYADVPVLHR